MARRKRKERPSVAQPDRLAKEIQAVLSDGLVKPKYRVPYRQRTSSYDGHCSHAAEAYRYLAKPRSGDLTVMNRTYDGHSHWWLVDSRGRIIDLTLGSDDKPGRFPYEQGTPRTFRRGKGRTGLSLAADEVVERVERARARKRPSSKQSPRRG